MDSRLRGVLCASILLALTPHAFPAAAQPTPVEGRSQAFAIPAQPLSSALILYGRQSGLQVAAPSELLRGRQSTDLQGSYPPAVALDTLLANSGLRWRRGPSGVVIEAEPVAASAAPAAAPAPAAPPTQLDDVLVQAFRADAGYRVDHSSTATRTATALRDVPQSMQIVSRQLIEDQQIKRLTDVLQNVSSVQMNGTGGNRGETYQIRGFVTPRYAINGFQLTSAMDRPEAFVDLANVEQVEVLKGPSSVMFGISEPGGVINIVTRAPAAEFATDGALTVGSFGFRRVEASATDALNATGTLSGRVTGAWQGEDGFRDHAAHSRRSFGAAALRWQPDAATQVDLAVDHVDQSQPFDRGLIATDEGVYVHDARRYLGESWSITEARKSVASLLVQHALSEDVGLRLSARHSDALVQDSGAVDLQGIEADGRSVRRRITDRREDSADTNLRLDAIIDARTGSLQHRLLAGAEYSRARMDFASGRANIASLDMYVPVYGLALRPVTRANAQNRYDVEMLSSYLQDQMEFSAAWKALLSVRHDAVRSSLDDTFNGVYTRNKDDAVTARAGVVYQPRPWASWYASYSESFQPQSGQTRAGGALSPERGQQLEVGTRLDLVPDRLTLTSALFQISKQDVATEDPLDPDFSILTGEQRVRGWEVDASGRIAEGWTLSANLSLLDAEITRDNTYAPGNRLVGVPRHSGRVWLHHAFGGMLQGLSIGGGATRVGARSVDLDNRFDIDGYTTFDATAAYAFSPRLELSLRLANLTDRFHVEGVQASNNLYPGSPRAFSLQVRMQL